jgi:hypothetical protein
MSHSGILPSLFVATIVAALSVTAVAAAPTLTAQLDRQVLREGETVDLMLRYSGGQPQAAPDLSVLEGDFEILGTQQGHRTTIVNGHRESSADWVVTLLPRTTGELTVPAIRAGDVSSAPVRLEVLERDVSATRGDSPDLFVEVEVEDDSPYVQGQVRYTVRVHDAVGILDGSLTEPEADELRVEPLGEDRTYDTSIDGRPYRVYERQYALFPQTSGSMVVPPVVLEAVVAESGRGRSSSFGGSFFDDAWSDFGGFGSSLFDRIMNPGRTVRVRSNAVTLDVRPRPEGADDGWFLPARDVELIEAWDPEPPTFRVGEAVTRTVALRALGAASEQLPEFDIPAAPEVRQYSDGAADRTVSTEAGVVSILQRSVAIVPTTAGAVTLPAVEVQWWDVEADEARVATLPARTIEVLAPDGSSPVDVAAVPSGPPSEPKPSASPAPAPAVRESTMDAFMAPGLFGAKVPAGWSWVIVATALAVIAAIAIVATRRSRERQTASGDDAPTDRDDRIGTWKNELRKACSADDPVAARDALMGWARVRWPSGGPLTPGAVASKLESLALAAAVADLDRALYSPGRHPDSPAPWNGHPLWRAFKAARGGRSRRRELGPVLPALYPDLSSAGSDPRSATTSARS